MTIDTLKKQAIDLADQASQLVESFENVSTDVMGQAQAVLPSTPQDNVFVMGLTVFVLACFVGYHVVWRVTPALHSPLMGVTNAISSVIIVGALIGAGAEDLSLSKIFAFLAVILAAVNIFGGFIVTQRMLSMFKKKEK